MDNEKVCPLCGKRPGTAASAKKTSQPVSYTAQKKNASSKALRNQSSSSRSASSRRASRSRKKANASGTSKPIVFWIILVLIVANLLIRTNTDFLSSFSTISIPSSVSSLLDTWEEDKTDLTSASLTTSECPTLLVGEWESAATGDTFRIRKNGTMLWSYDGETFHSDSDTSVEFTLYELSSDDAEDYLSEEEIEYYPPDSYVYYFAYVPCSSDVDTPSDDQYFNVWFYLPRDLYSLGESEVGWSIDAYDYSNDVYTVYTRTK
ncbi:MAG: hypothetical protein ACI4PM_03720 [Butyricicoccus sp.]